MHKSIICILNLIQEPQFEGRQVVTFHNQRDFIFVRHHRYIYRKDKENKTHAKLQELGPRFTLKLKWIQAGIYIYCIILILLKSIILKLFSTL